MKLLNSANCGNFASRGLVLLSMVFALSANAGIVQDQVPLFEVKEDSKIIVTKDFTFPEANQYGWSSVYTAKLDCVALGYHSSTREGLKPMQLKQGQSLEIIAVSLKDGPTRNYVGGMEPGEVSLALHDGINNAEIDINCFKQHAYSVTLWPWAGGDDPRTITVGLLRKVMDWSFWIATP